MQQSLFDGVPVQKVPPFKLQLLKWVGNKQRFAHEIISYFPNGFSRYFEPFLGSAAVMATLAPRRGIGTDAFAPLAGIWQSLKKDPEEVKKWYQERWQFFMDGEKKKRYEEIKARFNSNPNPADLLFLCRSCYGGVVRFRKDGYMSTPCGAHAPITPESFDRRVDAWSGRLAGCVFKNVDFREVMSEAGRGDVVYCDPPYSHSQSILYGAQSFSLDELFDAIAHCKERGAFVALSIDGHKRSGKVKCDINPPGGLFEKEAFVNCGRSMLKRFQMNGKSLEDEVVSDRLLLTS